MLQPTYTLLYVDDPEASGRFYAALLGLTPVEAGPTFVLFAFEGGLKLGLWSRHTVVPAATVAGGGTEIAVTVADDAALETTHAEWASRGLPILQAPTDMDFGRTFVALDPNGHRLRVFRPH
ncbi:VOC family protein [Methylobacterium frigidaeris]|uniref:Phenazine antibiotic resistance protein EhpR n=1 Tax=Methylobacterium frigidaeris TaxID=2038277 RepID=A0AA37HA13_9HYPH|nr:VOC family protein [Methylobacterium frigidaeris]PIK71727.1 drug:proton antiporter [Methylobacterium frigidaeris]GJD62178.1 Phenazine antibiotic resistance protein EhpR [Methylobacterium frigidaeris]